MHNRHGRNRELFDPAAYKTRKSNLILSVATHLCTEQTLVALEGTNTLFDRSISNTLAFEKCLKINIAR